MAKLKVMSHLINCEVFSSSHMISGSAWSVLQTSQCLNERVEANDICKETLSL